MRSRKSSTLALALLCLAAIPFVSDAGISVPPPSKAACCAVFEPPPPPPPAGDEEFFRTGGGVPNVMLLLDTSGSMLEFPRDIEWPALGLSGSNTFQSLGTCSPQTPFKGDSTVYDIADPKYDVPYDNGYRTSLVTDDPPWGLGQCTLKQARPTTDAATDYCLYRADSFYKFVNGANQSGGTFWAQTSAKVYNANPCSVVNAAGSVQRDFNGAVVTADAAACNACLTSKGYYFFVVRYRNSSGNWVNSQEQIVFSGRFLSAFPQKFIAARKVVKDIVKLDPSDATTMNTIRFGLTVFVASNTGGFSTSLRTNDGGKLVVPLGPDCATAFHDSQSTPDDFKGARQQIVTAINAVDPTTSNPTQVPFGGSTPLAEALFNIGQYFTNSSSSTGLYNTLFGTGWVRSSFAETASGSVNAQWAQAGQNRSFCWACQQSSIVVITDGAPNQDSNIPSAGTTTAHANFANDFRYWSNATIDCPACKCDLSFGGDTCTTPTPLVPSGGNIPNMMHKVAFFLKNTDLRPDLPNDTQPQNVATYTISFGVDGATDPAAIAVLQKTADLGGGIFSNTSSGEELRAALNTAVKDVVARATSFSSASSNSLQTTRTNQADAFLGRFKRTSSSMWEGHLFSAMIFDEFGQGCDSRFSTSGQKLFACGTKANQNPNMNGDETTDGKAICTSAYVVDQDCDPIIEDAIGNFKKGIFDPTTHQLSGGPDDANLFWDAGRVLSDPTRTGYRTAQEGQPNSRGIKTVLDVNGDGKYTAADGLVDFTVDNVAALAPAMGLDLAWCQSLLRRIGICGADPLPSCPTSWTSSAQQLCAAQIIHYVRGWDVLDADKDHCAGPGNFFNTNGWGSCSSDAQCGSAASCHEGRCVNDDCQNGEQRDRANDSRPAASQDFWKLGDIFHSSPVLVKPPVDKLLCKFAAENQCAMTLYSALGQSASSATPLASYGVLDAYDKFRQDNLNRQMVVLVGANDGMLHAFDAGGPDTSKPRNVDGSFPYTNGTGSELWAFIPPDLLPRLKKLMDAHQYLVDGNTMVRDVWVDHNGDGTKQADEFHTVAIVSERGGGTRFTALDVTNPTSPAFLWSFPEGCSPVSPTAGQSWADFLPRPPPIGPVRLKASGADPLGRGFEERWVVMLNGGYDPTLVRGRYVAMLDVWTGRMLWQFTDADFKAMRGDTKASMMPVAATVAMQDIGAADKPVGTFDTDGYFDTATWGDTGGNLFVARMLDPGEIDPSTGLVKNWFAARTFEMNRKADDTQAARGKSPFFFMTANYVETPSRMYTLLGSGNRERLLLQSPTCGPDNLLGCCQAQCSVASATFATSYGSGSCSTGGTFTCNGGALVYTPATANNCSTPFACGPATQTVTLSFDCGSAGRTGPITTQLSCDSSGSCSVDTSFSRSELDVTALMPACGPDAPRDCFFGIWSYGVQSEKLFKTLAEAKSFEANRFTDVPSFAGCGSIGTCSVVSVSHALAQDVGLTCLDGATKCKADVGDPGWKYCYGLRCPTQGCTGTWCDERTGSGPFGSRTCIGWSSFRPTGFVAGNDPCTTQSGTPTSINYVADFRAGVASANCNVYLDDSSGVLTYGRAVAKSAFAAPQNASKRIVVNARGEVNYSALKIEAGTGAEKINMGTRSNVAEPLYQIEIPRVVHACRHVDAGNCE
ncbi:MAG TPA: PilC/PilY family type IV pilus protein [Anaeromyxobacter sp.]